MVTQIYKFSGPFPPKFGGEGMTKYRVDRVGTGAYAGPLAKRHCTALHHATNYRQVAGDAGVRTVGADVLFECPRCLGCRDNGTYDWPVPLRKLKNDQSPAASMRSTRPTRYLVIPPQNIKISARFRTTSRLDREYLRNGTRRRQSENS